MIYWLAFVDKLFIFLLNKRTKGLRQWKIYERKDSATILWGVRRAEFKNHQCLGKICFGNGDRFFYRPARWKSPFLWWRCLATLVQCFSDGFEQITLSKYSKFVLQTLRSFLQTLKSLDLALRFLKAFHSKENFWIETITNFSGCHTFHTLDSLDTKLLLILISGLTSVALKHTRSNFEIFIC